MLVLQEVLVGRQYCLFNFLERLTIVVKKRADLIVGAVIIDAFMEVEGSFDFRKTLSDLGQLLSVTGPWLDQDVLQG